MSGLLARRAKKAAAGGWTPADVTTLGWWDSSDASTFTYSSGTVVEQWRDKSGNAYHFDQATPANQPDRSGTQNSLSTVVFDSSNDLMVAGSTSAWNTLHNGTTWIMGIAWRTTNSNPNKLLNILRTANINAGQVGFSLSYDDRSSVPRDDRMLLYVVRGTSGVPVDGVIGADDSFPAATFGCTTVLCDPDNATAADRAFVYTDNVLVSGTETSTSAVSASNSNTALRLLGLSDTSGIDGIQVGEIVIISGADATGANRVELDTYLQTKWGI